MRLSRRARTIAIEGAAIELRRGPDGVVQARGCGLGDFARALGFAHGVDRALQMDLTRIAARGQLAELVHDDDEAFAFDVQMRRMGFAAGAELELQTLEPGTRDFVERYCAGVNAAFARTRAPWELALLKRRPAPWTPQDCLVTVHLMSWLGLAETQEDLEKLLIQALRSGADVRKLQALFTPHLDAVDGELVELLRRVHLAAPLMSASLGCAVASPAWRASNAWALAPQRSASGHALLCCDPHLQVNRLPPIWYEMTAELDGGQLLIGASLPGCPGLAMGRTRDVAFGFTYGFMDMVDYFVEETRLGRYRRGARLVAFRERRELVRRRDRTVACTFLENDLGTLESEATLEGAAALDDGMHLLRAWSGRGCAAARSLASLHAVLQARTVESAQEALAPAGLSCNWLIADTAGHIGYQQSGLLPLRAHSGLLPLRAWDEANHWRGLAPTTALARTNDPAEGFLVSANGDHNQAGKPLSINAPMAPYREQRIAQCLHAQQRHSLEDMQRLQGDLRSRQAEAFMPLFAPHLPDTPAGRVLHDWDLCYARASRGAVLFERAWHEVLREVFGPLLGSDTLDELITRTGLPAMYFGAFDRALLGGDPLWFEGRTREQVFALAISRALAAFDDGKDGIPTWGEVQRATMRHLLLGGRLRWLRLDAGPFAIEGGRGSIVQSGAFRFHGRDTVFAPSWRFTTDLGTREAHTALAGGASDRPFSRFYRRGIRRWLERRYKVLRC